MSQLNTSKESPNQPSTSQENNVISIRGVREQNLPYLIVWVIFCAWTIVFAIWWTESPSINPVFVTEIRYLTHYVFLVSSTVFLFMIRKEWFLIFSRIGAISIVLSMAAFLLSHNSFT